jgi:hypothetical protein
MRAHAAIFATAIATSALFSAAMEPHCRPYIDARVTASDGRPIADATIAVAEERSSADRQRLVTDAQGHAAAELWPLDCPNPKEIHVAVCAVGYEPSRIVVPAKDQMFAFQRQLVAEKSSNVERPDFAAFQRRCVEFSQAGITLPPRPPPPPRSWVRAATAPATSPGEAIALMRAERRAMEEAESIPAYGVFKILTMDAQGASIQFASKDSRDGHRSSEIFRVEASPGHDIRRDIVKRIADVIATHYTDEFTWSSRSGEVLVLSIKPEDRTATEDRLFQDFFPAPDP